MVGVEGAVLGEGAADQHHSREMESVESLKLGKWIVSGNDGGMYNCGGL